MAASPVFALIDFARVSLVRRSRRRTLLTILAIASATVVFSAVMAVPYVINNIISAADASPRLVVINHNGMLYGLPESYYQKVANLRGVVAVNRMTWFGGVYDDPKHLFPTMSIDDNVDVVWPDYGLDSDALRAFRAERRAALVGIATMQRFNWHVGQLVQLRSQVYPVTLTFHIVGSFDTGPDLTAFMLRRDYLEEALHNPGRSDMLWIRVSDSAEQPRLAATIDAMFHNSSAETETDTEKVFMSNFLERFRTIVLLVEGIGLCAVVAIALAVLNAAALGLRERRGEIAVMKSLGFTGSQILAAIAFEGAIIALGGGILGTLIARVGLGLMRGMAPSLGPLLSFGLPGAVAAEGLAAALAIGLGAALLPALAPLRIPVVDSLRAIN
ncbi:MAG TPA: FtsX-like permease family protein [Candidatus Binataceae bacterium]|nr:FtsX-like permease family protein [Candidatus Binataceae bacterium]